MAAWAGFSDEDLRKLKQGTSNSGDGNNNRSSKKMGPGQGLGRAKMLPKDKQGSTRQPGPRHHFSTMPETVAEPLSPDQMLSLPKLKPDAGKSAKAENKADYRHHPAELEVKSNNSPSPQNLDVKTETKVVQDEVIFEEPKVESMGKELDEKEYLSREMTNLEKFRQQQKVIEEQNKKKKELLTSAIMQRKQKAKAEASKLTRIQKELTQLDEILHLDVSKIRDKIEEASREYMDAQKRYDRAEEEYIEAKMDLFKKQELKEQLTEHLYTIIHQNEVRKAKKLVELMEKLDMEEEDKPDLSMVEIPQLGLFTSVQLPIRTPGSPPVRPPGDLSTSSAPRDASTSLPEKKSSENQANNSGEVPSGNKSYHAESRTCDISNINSVTTCDAEHTTPLADKSSERQNCIPQGSQAEQNSKNEPSGANNISAEEIMSSIDTVPNSKTDKNKNDASTVEFSVEHIQEVKCDETMNS